MAPTRRDDDFAREIEAHLALETDRLIAEGADPAAARDQARRAFGNVTRVRERYHEARRVGWLEDLRRDVLSAIRNVRRAPLTAVVIVLSLAGGIGAATAALMVLNVVFFNPPPLYRAPAELSFVQAAPRDRVILPAGSDVATPLFRRWHEDLGDRVAAAIGGRPADLQRADGLETVWVRAVTPSLFSVLGIAPAAGRLFDSQRSGVAGEVVLSHRLWQRSFGSRSDIAGTRISLNGLPLTVIGVLPERFWFTGMGDDLWVAVDERLIPADAGLQVVIRRPPEMSPAGLHTALQRGLAAHNGEREPGTQPLHIRVSGVGGTPLGRMMAPAIPVIIGVAVMLVLFVGCANAAILLIAQWTARETDTAVRSSLGASRGRIVRALLTEAVLLSLTAGICGVAATFAVRWWVLTRSGADLAQFDLSVPPAVLMQSTVLAIGAGVLAGLAPALYETARLQINPLRGLQASDRLRQRWSHALVVAEISVTVAMLVVASTMVSGYQRLRDAQFGFETKPLAVAAVSSASGLAVRPVLDRVRALPGVRSAAVATGVPLFSPRPQRVVALDGAGNGATRAQWAAATPAFFETIGVAVRSGRALGERDMPESLTAVVNETLARRLFGTDMAAGRQIWIDGDPHTVIGVVADYAGSFAEIQIAAPRFFLPLASQPRGTRFLYVVARVDSSPTALVESMRRAVRSADGDNPVVDVFTYSGRIAMGNQEWLLSIAPLGPLVTIGTLLTAAGIYGVLAFAIARRTRELAIRVALGASVADQTLLVTLRSLRLIAIGTSIGVGLTFALSRVVRTLGGGGSMYDPPWSAFAVPVAIILLVGAIATWLPSVRARRVDPSMLLRTT
jgi:putative ABC transport system permease protein